MGGKGTGNEITQIHIGAKADEIVKCSRCGKELLGTQSYTYKGKKGESIHLCETCRDITEKSFEAETKNPNMVMAVLAGVAAAVIGGVIWIALTVITGYQVGYVAIGVGFIIGNAVIWGAGKKRGAPLQIVSALTTLVTLLVSQYVINLYYIRKYLLEHQTDYPDYNGDWIFISPLNPDVLKNMFSPMGLLIWGIGIYFAYSLPKTRAI